METLYLYTEDFFWTGRAKKLLKKLAGRDFGGPKAVFSSFVKGLSELKVPYRVNTKDFDMVPRACVFSGIKTLDWVLKQKAKGKIGEVVAGPNLVVMPEDFEGILKNPDIDKIVVPSQWVRQAYSQQAPELAGKIIVWPAGVELPPLVSTAKNLDFLIYNKIGSNLLAEDIKKFLFSQKKTFQVLEYGNFNQNTYFKLLEQSRKLIYLSESESQGLGMFEAWAQDVPTLVWERGFWQKGNTRIEGQTASPYLTDECGLRFKDFKEFQEIFPQLPNQKFSPRTFVEANFSNAKATANYLKLIGYEIA